MKTTQTYEEDESLHKHIQTLQNIDSVLTQEEIEGNDIEKEIYNLIIHID